MDRLGAAIRFIAAIAIGWLTWFLLYSFSHDETLVAWSCNGIECGTSDWQPMGIFAGSVGIIVFSLLAGRFTQRATVGIALALFSGALAVGWHDSTIDLGVVGIDGWITTFSVFALVGVFLAIVGGLHTIRRTAIIPRTFGGHIVVDARAYDWITDGDRRGTANVTFIDHNRQRRDVRLPLAAHYCSRPLLAVYDPRDPASVLKPRIGVPRVPILGAQRKRDISRLRDALKVDGADESPQPAINHDARPLITAELERLAKLRADGALTDDEFAAAKRRVLEM